ncbi:MAG: hypothetical protein R3F29_08905 [Planctomycetota bacterium]
MVAMLRLMLLLLACLAASCSGSMPEPATTAPEAVAEPGSSVESELRQLVQDLLAACTTRSRRLVRESDWRRAAAMRDTLHATWSTVTSIPVGSAGEEAKVIEALVVFSGPFRRSVLVRAPEGLRSPFLVGDEGVWRRAEQVKAH